MIKFFAGLTACFVVLCAGIAYRHNSQPQALIRFYRPPRLCLVCDALASRNSSGTYTIPNSFSAGSVISSSAVNANFSDIGTELTSSLDRAGRGAMTAQLQLASGTVTTPGLGFSSDTGSGLYRIGSADIGFAISGTKKLELTSSLFTVTPATVFTGGITSNVAASTQVKFFASTDSPIGIFSSTTVPGVSSNITNDGSTGWKYSTSNTAGGALLEMGGNGYLFYTAPNGTAGNAVTLTERMRVSPSGVTIGVSGTTVSQAQNATAVGCTTAAAAAAACGTTVTFANAFADTSYRMVCTCGTVASGVPFIQSYLNASTTQSTVVTLALTAVAAKCDPTCWAWHN